MWKYKRWALIITLTLFVASALPLPALAAPPAHDAPPGSEWVMADWMFLSFILFAGAAFVGFILALKAGLLSNLEEAKYHILEIEEDDYYTPDWAREEDET